MSRSVSEIRKDFPQISDDFVYFDNAATTFKPQSVIDAMTHFYESKNANVRRSIYDLGEEATELYENARTIVRQFVGADDSYEVVFARNTTEAINLVARGLDYKVVILGGREHHSNLLPWFQNENIVVHQADANNDILKHPKLSTKADILAISAWSNVLGKETRLNEILDNSNDYCRIKLVDAAQWVANEKISMNNIDLLAFSGHKMYGPMGIGVLVAKKGLLEKMRPLYWGGEMVDAVHRTASSDWHNAFIKAQLTDIPQRFEAGTPNVAGAVGPVRRDHLDAHVVQLGALLGPPVGLGQLPALIPVVEQEGPEHDAHIRHAVVGEEGAVGQGHHGLAQQHLVDDVGLVAQLGIGEQLDGQVYVLRGQQLLPLLQALADGLGHGVLKADLQHFGAGGGGENQHQHQGDRKEFLHGKIPPFYL